MARLFKRQPGEHNDGKDDAETKAARRRQSSSAAQQVQTPGGGMSDETRAVLDTTIASIVQALGSRAGVIGFLDENGTRMGYLSGYGLSERVLDELRPAVASIVARMIAQRQSGGEPAAIRTDVQTAPGALHMVALPLLSGDQLIGALCLLQTPGMTALVDIEATPAIADTDDQPRGLLPGSSDLATLPYPTRKGDAPLLHLHDDDTTAIVDQSDVLTRTAQLLQRLIEEKDLLEAVVRYSADGLLIVDNQGKIIGFNAAFERLSGWTVEELRGKSSTDAFGLLHIHDVQDGIHDKGENPDGCPHWMSDLTQPTKWSLPAPAADSQAWNKHHEVSLVTKDGETRTVELTHSLILSPDRHVLGSVIGARDITARKEAEELQATFLSVISHELQTPIAIIKGYAGLLADEEMGDVPPEKLRDQMRIIADESDRLSRMVDNLLYASRIQAGGVQLTREEVDIAALIYNVARRMQNVSSSHTILTDVPPDGLPPVRADYERLREVLVNLVENAIKYSPDGGPITLSADATPSEVVVSVTDRGVGIPLGERERVFDRFSRLEGRLLRQRKGAGLGLYIAKSIIEAHGGRIWVVPSPPPTPEEIEAGAQAAPDTKNPGSQFVFALPRQTPDNLPVLFGS